MTDQTTTDSFTGFDTDLTTGNDSQVIDFDAHNYQPQTFSSEMEGTTTEDYSHLSDGDQIRVMPDQLIDFPLGNTRQYRDPQKEKEIMDSMRNRWIIQPVVARVSNDGTKLELLGGYGRRDKAKVINAENDKQGQPVRPVPVLVRLCDDAEAYAIHLAENTQRENLSIIEEAHAARTYLTFHAGDRLVAAKELGWETKKFNERLELNKCTHNVQMAVQKRQITAAHAILLAPFPEHVQDKQVDNIIANKVSVKDLRLTIGKVQKKLRDARFDATECASCPHNNSDQLGLFGGVENNAGCSMPKCFNEKTQTWLEQQRKLAEERYGTVLFLSETGESDRNTLTVDNVGKDQMESGCSACKSNVVVMTDTAGKEGLITENQCIDKVCFAKLAGQQVTDTIALKSSASKTTPKQFNPASSGKSNDVVAPKKTVSKLPEKVVTQHRKVLREAAASHFEKNVKFQLACTLTSLCAASDYHPNDSNEWHSGMAKTLPLAMQMELDEIKKHTLAAIKNMATSTTSFGATGNGDVTNAMIKVLATDKANAISVATSAWTFSKENVQDYTIKDLIRLGEKSGIAAAIDTAENGAWAKLKKGGKAAIVTALVDSKHDTSSFAPAEYLAHVSV